MEACHNAQDAQARYACDYQNMRAAKSCNEVKECIKGHRKLHGSISCNRPAYIGKRHVTPLCADAYGKGITRSQQESINLRVAGANEDVTSVESFHTASSVVFLGRDLIQWRESMYQNADYVKMLGAISADRRDSRCETPIIRNLVFLWPQTVDSFNLVLVAVRIHDLLDRRIGDVQFESLRQEPGGVPRDFDGRRPGKDAAASGK